MTKILMSNLKNTILEGAEALWPEMVSLRRHFHANPELSYKEYETASFICSYLERQGIPFINGIAGTGIIATIEGKLSGKRVVALRAELDALPVNEENDVEYRSRNNGVMHACGHDAHMAMLLGSAVMLNRLRDNFGGKVLLVFQPGEEKSPGGASLMIESGAFDEIPPDMVIAQHILPELETGCVGYRAGRYMASADEIYITVRGKGGHAALSREVTDQIYIASELVLTLKDTIAAEQSGRNIPTVFGLGRITGEGATNVIPATVEIAGTFRTFDETWRSDAISTIRKIAGAIAAKYKVEIDVTTGSGYPVLVNDESLAERAVVLSRQLIGDANVKMMDTRMSSDDFAFFTEKYPSLYYRVGVMNPGESPRPLHTSRFDINEEAIRTGAANMTWLTINLMAD